MARPRKLDDLAAKRIVDAVSKGYPRDTAAKLARIAPSTLYLWLRKGRQGEAGYSEFLERVKEAEAKGEAELVDRIRAQGRETWQANAWLLERRRPSVWALRRGLDRLVSTDAKQFEGMSPAQLRARVEEQIARLQEVREQLAREDDETKEAAGEAATAEKG